MLNLILEWLNQKQNYVSYQPKQDDMTAFQDKLSNMLIAARVHFENLEASDCYIIQNISDKIDYSYEHPTHYRYNFENFNIKRNEYIYNKANMSEAAKNFTIEDTVRNRAIALVLLNELQHTTISKNKFLEKFDKYSYKDIFFDIKEDSIIQAKSEVENLLLNNEFTFEDFKSDYIDKIKDESRGLQEIGIFYPFVFNHNIFESAHFLFEINHLKFQKDDKNFLDIVKNFYKEYGVNCYQSKDIFKLKQYFAYPGFEYSKHFAYFDPFKNYEKYKTEYKQIRENITLKRLEFKDFIHELFEALNKAQIGIIKFQHENLIDTLITKRSQNRQYSIRELIDIQMDKFQNNELSTNDIVIDFNYFASLSLFQKLPSNFKITKNMNISDIYIFSDMPKSIRDVAQFILNDLFSVLNKHDSSKLQYIFDHYKNELNVIIKKYKLNLQNKHIVYDMLLDLVFFYNDKKKEKLSKPFNSTIAKIYTKNQNKDIEKIMDFGFQTKFMQQYDEYFNMYRPCAIKTENGQTKYMMKF